MVWSLANSMKASAVEELLSDAEKNYPPDVARFYSREQALAIIHAALWGYGVRQDSTAGAYAATNLFDALGLKWWTFDEVEAAAHQKLSQEMRVAKFAAKSTDQ